MRMHFFMSITQLSKDVDIYIFFRTDMLMDGLYSSVQLPVETR